MVKRERLRHAVGAISPAVMGYLLGESSRARTDGEMVWTSDKPRDVRNRVTVLTGTIEVEGAYLQMQYNTPRPWAISLLYRGADVPIRRVCVHGNGHGFGHATHMHTYRSADGGEECVLVPDSFPECPISSSVTNDDRRMMFMAFAGLCHVSTDTLTWVDPPEKEER